MQKQKRVQRINSSLPILLISKTRLGARNALILQNHGLLTVGATIAQTFYRMYYLEQSCRIQIAAQSTGVALHVPSEAQILRARKQFEDDPDEGRLIWQALRRKLDREQPDYRD